MNIFFWTRYPLVQIGIPYSLGCIVAYSAIELPAFKLNHFQFIFLMYISIGLCLITASLLFIKDTKIIRKAGIFSILFFAIGIVRFITYDNRCSKLNIHFHDNHTISAISGEIVTEPEKKNKALHFTLSLSKVKISNQWTETRGLVKIVVADTSTNTSIHDHLIIIGELKKTSKAATPFDFDYATFLAYQNIHHTLYSTKNPILIQRDNFPLSIKFYAVKARQSLEKLLTDKLSQKRDYALVTGLLIGKRTDLCKEDKHLFTSSGTIHVLAVSGMHVVLLYQCLCLIVSIIKVRQHSISFNSIVLCIIWFYIFITGLQASATRAAIMISFVLIAKLLRRDNPSINSFFATAFLMLLYNPYYIADAGFILSFLAVAGIVISSGISQDNKKRGPIKTYFINASIISIAAQTATFPYSIHLFDQFPVYFLVANLIVVPITTLMLFLSILLILTYSIPYVCDFIVLIVGYATDVLFFTLKLLEQSPCPLITKISLSSYEMCMLYSLLILILLLFIQRKVEWLWGISICSVLLFGSVNIRMIWAYHHPSIYITGKGDQRQYLLSSGRHLQVLQFSRNPVYNASAEKFTTENFTKYDSTVVLNSESHITIVHRNKYYCIYFQPPIDIQNCSEKTQKCEAIILDYTGKSSYLDPDNKSTLKHQSFFSLNRKKSFYSMLYEMDSN